jgi:hypothetical protein
MQEPVLIDPETKKLKNKYAEGITPSVRIQYEKEYASVVRILEAYVPHEDIIKIIHQATQENYEAAIHLLNKYPSVKYNLITDQATVQLYIATPTGTVII